MKFKGTIWKFGDNINTDTIISGCYISSSEPKLLGSHCMETLIKKFHKLIHPGDIIVAGRNFGCGSSRQQAVIALKACGISCVIAKSYSRIFFRNAINTGFPVIQSSETVDLVSPKDKILVDLDAGCIKHFASNRQIQISPFPPFLRGIIESNGLINYVTKKNNLYFADSKLHKRKKIATKL